MPSSSHDDQSLTPEQYLQKHQIAYYMRDVVGLLLKARDDHPLNFIADYFSEVLGGTHVLLREFAYVNRSSHDRWAFVASAREALADLDQGAPTTASGLMQLLRLVCPDFPLEVVADACRLCGDELGAHPLGRLLHSTCVRLCFSDFLMHRVVETFRSVDVRGTGRVDRGTVGLALRQRAGAMTSGERPPAGLFDELQQPRQAGADLTLTELQQMIVHAASMYALFVDSSDDGTLVASPPPRGHEAYSPGTCAALALSRAGVGSASLVGGGAGGGRRRLHSAGLHSAGSRERFMEAAAAAAKKAPARAGSAKTRRTVAGTGFAGAARAIAAGAAAGATPPATPRVIG